MGTDHEHRVCTYEEAERAVRSHGRIFLNDCFCRKPARDGVTPWEYCGHEVETCFGFREPKGGDAPYQYREITPAEALEIVERWKAQGNFFRFMGDEEWVCCCCGCGCQWFRDKEGNLADDTCRKGRFIERTDRELCSLCADCVDACAYTARAVEDGALVVDPERCYGCSACEPACPEDAIAMVPR